MRNSQMFEAVSSRTVTACQHVVAVRRSGWSGVRPHRGAAHLGLCVCVGMPRSCTDGVTLTSAASPMFSRSHFGINAPPGLSLLHF
eukprot:NODE_11524_length_1281_cov_5.514731.p3 GENE.NODE_11524_length_1281_cov_5.514731~~NODE_11524_length_1281_cov_5.514731.p3  ORF type:complete len:86 (-),score=1.31 NODE_11524_length_1281_cov_5.514731:891-1148(-)